MFIFGGDIGFKQFKGVNLSNDIEFSFQNIIGFPSSLEIHSSLQQADNLLGDLSIRYKDEWYYIGQKAEQEATNHRYTFLANKVDTIDETIKLLTSLGVLQEMGIETIDLFVTGIPVEEYHLIKDKLQQEFVNTYSYEFRGKPYQSRISEVIVVPQGAGDYYDYILTEHSTIIDSRILPKTVVINIGYRTTEIVTMNYGKFSRNESTTLYTATNSFHKELRRLLAKEYGIRKNLTQIDDIYRTGVIFIKGEEIDISDLRDKAVDHHIGTILGEIPVWVNTDDIHKILLSGGGSTGLKDHFTQEFGDIVEELPNPEYGNARGFYKYGGLIRHARTAVKAVKKV